MLPGQIAKSKQDLRTDANSAPELIFWQCNGYIGGKPFSVENARDTWGDMFQQAIYSQWFRKKVHETWSACNVFVRMEKFQKVLY